MVNFEEYMQETYSGLDEQELVVERAKELTYYYNKKSSARVIIKKEPKCVYCLETDNLTVDHIIPFSRYRKYGISIREINSRGNLVTSCQPCNYSKGSDLEQFFKENPQALHNLLNLRYNLDPKVVGILENLVL